jgi:hypothetical protein
LVLMKLLLVYAMDEKYENLPFSWATICQYSKQALILPTLDLKAHFISYKDEKVILSGVPFLEGKNGY